MVYGRAMNEEVYNEIALGLEACLEEKSGEVALLKVDFRRLEARFVCRAEGNEGICSRSRPSGSKPCSFQDLNGTVTYCLAES